ncbi:MAG: DUF2946 family protein [Pseudomonadota bacterium]
MRPFTGMLVACVLLQALIPVGYMPSSFADGAPVKFCPSGMPDAVVAAIYGEHHHHNHSDDFEFERCELAGGPATAILAEVPEHRIARLDNTLQQPVSVAVAPTSKRPFNYQPRAPPTPEINALAI